MSKTIRALLACLLALSLCLLSACAPLDSLFGGEKESAGLSAKGGSAGRGVTVRFDRMEYVRPELAELTELLEQARESLDGGSYSRARNRLDDCHAWFDSFYTMYNLSYVRSCQDMTDEYYAEEYRWCDEQYSVVQQLFEELYYDCAASPLADKLQERYFWDGFLEEYSDPEASFYSDEYVALMQEESELLARYRALQAAPTLERDGAEVELAELLPELAGPDYVQAVTDYLEKYNEAFAELYIRLVDVRCRMAEAQGFDSYEQMQYEISFERDYTPAEAEDYLLRIRQEMVPFYRELMARDPYGEVWYDLVDEEGLLDILGAAAGEIGGRVKKAYDFMRQYELCDVRVDGRKANMSFQTYFTDYAAPFIFLGAAGDTEDILSFAHEFGHFTDAYVNEDANETIDLAECYSQAMEFLVLSRLGSALEPEELDNVARLKMLDTAALYVQQGAFAEFEHQVYAMGAGQLSAERLNDLSRQLAMQYGFYTPAYDAYYAMGWIDVTHFFEMPFYVITYPVSNDIAMQLYAMELDEPGTGLKRYLGVLPRDYAGLMALVDAGDFDSPFGEGRIRDVVRIMRGVFDL